MSPVSPAPPEDAQPGPASPTPASVLGKANQLLAAFVNGPSAIGLTELSQRSGVPKASAHRLAGELVDLGLLARSGTKYRLGWRIFELGQLVPGPAQLRAVSRPALTDLRAATRAAIVNLAVPRGDDCVYLERVGGRREWALIHGVGSRMPKYSTASGLLFLAYADTQRRPAVDEVAIRGLGLPNQTALDKVYDLIRHRRYAEEIQQVVSGFKTRAVPVFFPATEHVVAAISITTPTDRHDDQQILHALWTAAGEISHGLRAPTRRET